MRLIDATRIGQVGRGGDAWRVHWDYDLSAARLGQVVVTDHHGGERLDRFVLAPDDIVVADSGYGYRRSVAHARSQRADVVLRCHPATCPVEDASGQWFDVLAWLSEPGPATRSWSGWCRWNGVRLAVRLIASALPPDQAQAAHISLETLRQEVLGRWSRARLRACLPRLRRFLCISPRKREQQEAQIRDWLCHRTQAPVLESAA